MAASIEFVPRYIRGAIAALQAGMAAQVAAFNAEAVNTVDLVAPATYIFGASDQHAALAFPVVEVAAVQGQTGQWRIHRTDVDHDVTLNVVVWLEGTTGEVGPVYEQLLGMARCVIEILSPPDAIAPGAEIPNERGIYWRVSEAVPPRPGRPEPRDLEVARPRLSAAADRGRRALRLDRPIVGRARPRNR